jgi:hypothetical protein
MATGMGGNGVATVRAEWIVGGLFGLALVGVQYTLSVGTHMLSGTGADWEVAILLTWCVGLFVAGIVAGVGTGRAEAGMLAGCCGALTGALIELAVLLVVETTHRDWIPLVSFSLGNDPITLPFIAYILEIYVLYGLLACVIGAIVGGMGGIYGHMFYRPPPLREASLEDVGYVEGESLPHRGHDDHLHAPFPASTRISTDRSLMNTRLSRAKAGLIGILVGVLSGVGVLGMYYGLQALGGTLPGWNGTLQLVANLLWLAGFLVPGIVPGMVAGMWTGRALAGALAGSCGAYVWILGWLVAKAVGAGGFMPLVYITRGGNGPVPGPLQPYLAEQYCILLGITFMMGLVTGASGGAIGEAASRKWRRWRAWPLPREVPLEQAKTSFRASGADGPAVLARKRARSTNLRIGAAVSCFLLLAGLILTIRNAPTSSGKSEPPPLVWTTQQQPRLVQNSAGVFALKEIEVTTMKELRFYYAFHSSHHGTLHVAAVSSLMADQQQPVTLSATVLSLGTIDEFSVGLIRVQYLDRVGQTIALSITSPQEGSVRWQLTPLKQLIAEPNPEREEYYSFPVDQHLFPAILWSGPRSNHAGPSPGSMVSFFKNATGTHYIFLEVDYLGKVAVITREQCVELVGEQVCY